jgi:hypothetical protein
MSESRPTSGRRFSRPVRGLALTRMPAVVLATHRPQGMHLTSGPLTLAVPHLPEV